MKHKKHQTICSILMLLSLLVTSIGVSLQPVYAENRSDKTNYVAFGDSIAAGYGLDGYSDNQTAAPGDSYQALVASFLHTQSANYAITGDNSDDCMELLHSGKADADLANADIITLSIGSNDLLLPFIQILLDFFEINPETLDPSAIPEQLKTGFPLPQIDVTKMAEYYEKAEELLTLLSDNETLHAQTAAFPEKFQTIVSILHDKAPDAEIYATNIYNPFVTIPKIGELADIYIQEMNKAFSKNASGYTLIDVYTPFYEKQLTNVNIDFKQPYDFRLDPHPSVQGHAKIANLIIRACKQAHAPKAAELRKLSTSSKQTLTVKATVPADADGYQVLYAAKKNGSYQQLGTSDNTTFRTNSKKLKAKKTYYVKLRSYKVIKGVTYYGADSPAKKITIK